MLVVDNGGRVDEACVGDLVALEAQAAGLAGVVIWAQGGSLGVTAAKTGIRKTLLHRHMAASDQPA